MNTGVFNPAILFNRIANAYALSGQITNPSERTVMNYPITKNSRHTVVHRELHYVSPTSEKRFGWVSLNQDFLAAHDVDTLLQLAETLASHIIDSITTLRGSHRRAYAIHKRLEDAECGAVIADAT